MLFETIWALLFYFYLFLYSYLEQKFTQITFEINQSIIKVNKPHLTARHKIIRKINNAGEDLLIDLLIDWLIDLFIIYFILHKNIKIRGNKITQLKIVLFKNCNERKEHTE